MPKIETREITIKKEDNLWNIVKAAGFPPKDWKKIYMAEYNIKFRGKRKDPNRIYPGDKLKLPKYGPNEIEVVRKKAKKLEEDLKKDTAIYEKKMNEFNKAATKASREETSILVKVVQCDMALEKLEKQADSIKNLSIFTMFKTPLPSKELKTKIKTTRSACNKLSADYSKKKSLSGKQLDRIGSYLDAVSKSVRATNGQLDKAEAELSKAKKNPY